MTNRWLLIFNLLIFLVGCASGEIDLSSAKISSQAIYDKAQKYYQTQKYDDAKEYFHEFLAENPDEPLKTIAMYYLGHCYQMTGDLKEAKSIYNRVVTNATGDEFWIGVARRRIAELE